MTSPPLTVKLKPGKYILALSGGVDSMTLLDLLAKKNSVELVVAYFNHGIRQDSHLDEELVKKTAQKYNLPVETGSGQLGPNASEAKARQARYDFLDKTRKKHRAAAIITAHHQDDMIETAFINLLRGTGRYGLTKMQSQHLIRPLINITKNDILTYAIKNKLTWRDDKTNNDLKYLRNFLRHQVIPKLSPEGRENIVVNIDKVANLNREIDMIIATLSHTKVNGQLSRSFFSNLPSAVADEYLAFWLRGSGLANFDSRTLKRLSIAIKTGPPGSSQPVYGGWRLSLSKQSATLLHP